MSERARKEPQVAEPLSPPSLGLRDTHLRLPGNERTLSAHLISTEENLSNAEKSLQAWMEEYVLPSWIPDWRDPIAESAYLLNPINNCHYKASGNTSPSVRCPADKSVMIVSGMRFDTVSAIAPPKEDGRNTFDHAFKSGLETWRNGTHPRHVYGNKKQQEDAFLQTVVAARNGDGTKGTCQLSIPTLNYMYKLGLTDESRQNAREVDTEGSDTSVSSDIVHLKDYFIPIYRLSKHFTFCATANGFMGRVPIGTSVDDIVVIFLGAKVPFVLRKYKEEDRYYLLGECCTSTKSDFLNNIC